MVLSEKWRVSKGKYNIKKFHLVTLHAPLPAPVAPLTCCWTPGSAWAGWWPHLPLAGSPTPYPPPHGRTGASWILWQETLNLPLLRAELTPQWVQLGPQILLLLLLRCLLCSPLVNPSLGMLAPFLLTFILGLGFFLFLFFCLPLLPGRPLFKNSLSPS